MNIVIGFIGCVLFGAVSGLIIRSKAISLIVSLLGGAGIMYLALNYL